MRSDAALALLLLGCHGVARGWLVVLFEINGTRGLLHVRFIYPLLYSERRVVTNFQERGIVCYTGLRHVFRRIEPPIRRYRARWTVRDGQERALSYSRGAALSFRSRSRARSRARARSTSSSPLQKRAEGTRPTHTHTPPGGTLCRDY